jgi:hypothetical protein
MAAPRLRETLPASNTIVANSLTSGNGGGDLVGSPTINTSNWIGTLDLETLQNNGVDSIVSPMVQPLHESVAFDQELWMGGWVEFGL